MTDSGLPAPARVAARAWQERLSSSAPKQGQLLVAWAPGRINLIGEHTDYNEGWALPAAIDRVIAAAGVATTTPHATLFSAHHNGYAHFDCSPEALRAAPPRRLPLWARFARATLAELSLVGSWQGKGVIAAIAGDVPVGGGLSSSAAVEIAFANLALSLAGVAMEPLDVALLCQRAEQRGAHVRVGVLDQAASCLGREGQAILLDCRSLAYTYAPAEPSNTGWVVFDTGAPHTLATSGYNQRRAQCEEAVRRLAEVITEQEPERMVTALRDVTTTDLQRFGAKLDPMLLMRARHVVDEDARTLAAADALRASEAARLGALMDESHASLRDLYEVSSAELNIAVDIARSVRGVLGARMMGAGFGGSILALAEVSAIPQLSHELATVYPRRAGRQGRLMNVHTGGGPAREALALDSGDMAAL